MSDYSTIPAATDQLLVALNARSGLDGVLIADGYPGTADVPVERERVFVDDPVNVRRVWAQLGQYRIDESYAIKVIVEVQTDGNDRSATRARLFEIIAEVEQAAVLDITLTGVLNWGVKPGPIDPVVIPVDHGWMGQAVLQLECSGRIQAS